MAEAPTPQIGEISDLPIDSYALMTADGILKSYGINLTPEQIVDQLACQQSFYKFMLNLPARQIKNNIAREQNHDILKIYNDTLLNLHSDIETRRAAAEEAQTTSSVVLNYYKTLEDCIQLGENLTKIDDEAEQLDNSIKELNNKHLEQWRELQQANTEKIATELLDQGMRLPKNFKQKLHEQLCKMAADVKLTKQEQADFIFDEDDDEYKNIIKQAIIAALREEEA